MAQSAGSGANDSESGAGSEDDYETVRQRNIAHNQALMRDLGLDTARPKKDTKRPPPRKKQKTAVTPTPPSRISARIASQPSTSYLLPKPITPRKGRRVTPRSRLQKPRGQQAVATSPSSSETEESADAGTSDDRLQDLVRKWQSWTPSGPDPTRDDDGLFHFGDFPVFQPNKAPAEILREGAFGGSYFRPLYSKRLKVTVEDDWRELPRDWLSGIDVDRYLVSPEYDPSVNKCGVACGQSIEQWEENGWIAHDFDVRGWFQWYCRFFQGRRCADDERQVGRWARCVGAKGRWKRTLLKQYWARGIRYVMDEEGGEGGELGDVSPVITQTCLHWAWEPRQRDLDEYFATV